MKINNLLNVSVIAMAVVGSQAPAAKASFISLKAADVSGLPFYLSNPSTTMRHCHQSLQRMVDIKELAEIKAQYKQHRHVMIDGDKMAKILFLLGATPDDVERLKAVSDHLAPDPTLAFRETRTGRFLLDFDRQKIVRTERQPFMLTQDEDFIRHDAGKPREFHEIQDELQLNTAFQALMRFKANLIHGIKVAPRKNLNYADNNVVSTAFNLRIVTTKALQGELAIEGVHADGVDHTMTTFLGGRGMAKTKDNAVITVYDMRQPTGAAWNETNPDTVILDVQQTRFLDTLVFVDHEVKHGASPLFADSVDQRATRDMFVILSRKQTQSQHASYQYDSVKPHQEMPLEIDLGLLEELDADHC